VPHHTLSWIVGACVSARWAGRAHAITGDGASKWIRASLVAANWLYQHTSSAGNCVWWLCLCVHSTWPCSFGMDTALVWCHLVPGLPCACLHSPIGSLWSASHNHRLECGLGGRLLFHQQRRPLSVLLLLMDRHSISPSKYYSLFSLSLPFLLSRILPAIFCVWTGSHEAGRGEWERRKLKSGQVIPLCSRLSSMLSNCARVFHFTISACSRTSGCALGCLVVVYVWWRASSRVLVSCVCVFAVVWWLATTGTVSLIPTTAIYFRGQSMVDVAVAYFRFFLIISYSCIIHPHFTISWLWSIVFNCEC